MARSKTALALLFLAGLMTLTVPLAAQEDEEYDLPSVMAEFWASETGQDLIAEYTADPATSGTSDPTGDFEHSTGEEPGLAPTGTLDIVETRATGFEPMFDTWDAPPDTPSFFDSEANGGVFCETDPFNPVIPGVRTICPQEGFDPVAFADGAFVSVIETAEPFGLFNLSQTCEWVMWYRNPTNGEIFSALPDFPLDPADGTNQAVGLRIGPNQSGPFRLDLGPEGFFQPTPTNTLVAIGENQIAFFVPQTETAPADGARAYTFCTEGSFQASDSVADSTSFFDVSFEVAVEMVPPPAPTSTTTAPTTTTTEATTTTTASTDTTLVEAADDANLESGSFSRFIPLIVIAGIVVVGITLYWRTRERGAGGGDTTPSGGRDGEAGLTPPLASVVDDTAHGRCDWALYFLDDGVRKLLREPDGHECCVYEVQVRTAIDFHDEAMRGRQDAESIHVEGASADERLRIPDLGFGQAGNGVWGWASARSGPAGRLDWMQGRGDPRANAGRDTDHSESMQLTQHRTLEEGPDVAAHLLHLETTTVKATLEPGCPDHENTYKLNGTSQALVQSTYECTNSAPGPECPVELTAAAWVAGGLAGDLNYWASEISTSDVDEVEPLAERVRQRMEVDGPMAMTDSHDHATRPRDTYESTRTGSGANTLATDTTSFSLLSGLRFESGTIVPVATWPNTERVTADVYGDVGHDVTVDARMAKGDCSQGCCDVAECRCAPEFTLAVGANSGRLTVDGKTFDITRPMPEGDWRLA